jgi:hypothetical protein
VGDVTWPQPIGPLARPLVLCAVRCGDAAGGVHGPLRLVRRCVLYGISTTRRFIRK